MLNLFGQVSLLQRTFVKYDWMMDAIESFTEAAANSETQSLKLQLYGWPLRFFELFFQDFICLTLYTDGLF